MATLYLLTILPGYDPSPLDCSVDRIIYNTFSLFLILLIWVDNTTWSNIICWAR